MQKRINQYTLDGEFIMTHESPRAATEHIGKVHRTTISSAASYNRPHAFGYIWRYVDDPNKYGTEHAKNYDKDKTARQMTALTGNRFNL